MKILSSSRVKIGAAGQVLASKLAIFYNFEALNLGKSDFCKAIVPSPSQHRA